MGKSISEITVEYLESAKLNAEQFAMLLGQHIEVSEGDVIDWLLGISKPEKYSLIRLVMRCRDWRFDFGVACLAYAELEIWGSDDLTQMVVAMRIANETLRHELVDEMAFTAELTEQLER